MEDSDSKGEVLQSSKLQCLIWHGAKKSLALASRLPCQFIHASEMCDMAIIHLHQALYFVGGRTVLIRDLLYSKL